PLSLRIRSPADAIASGAREAIDTCAPSDANARATAKPRPLLAPPTMAIFPVRCRSICRFGSYGSLASLPIDPRDDAVERLSRRLIELSARRPDHRVRNRAAPREHLFADGHPDA